MSEIKNVGYTWMALNNFKCNHLIPLHIKGLITAELLHVCVCVTTIDVVNHIDVLRHLPVVSGICYNTSWHVYAFVSFMLVLEPQ